MSFKDKFKNDKKTALLKKYIIEGWKRMKEENMGWEREEVMRVSQDSAIQKPELYCKSQNV